MTNSISLQEAFDKIKDDPLAASTDPQVLQFLSDVDSYATDILSFKDDEFILGCISLVQAICVGTLCTQAMNDGDLVQVAKLIKLSSSSEFSSMVTLIFKASVGIAALEELR